jgi:hypothetical protein
MPASQNETRRVTGVWNTIPSGRKSNMRSVAPGKPAGVIPLVKVKSTSVESLKAPEGKVILELDKLRLPPLGGITPVMFNVESSVIA